MISINISLDTVNGSSPHGEVAASGDGEHVRGCVRTNPPPPPGRKPYFSETCFPLAAPTPTNKKRVSGLHEQQHRYARVAGQVPVDERVEQQVDGEQPQLNDQHGRVPELG